MPFFFSYENSFPYSYRKLVMPSVHADHHRSKPVQSVCHVFRQCAKNPRMSCLIQIPPCAWLKTSSWKKLFHWCCAASIILFCQYTTFVAIEGKNSIVFTQVQILSLRHRLTCIGLSVRIHRNLAPISPKISPCTPSCGFNQLTHTEPIVIIRGSFKEHSLWANLLEELFSYVLKGMKPYISFLKSLRKL